MPIRRSNASSCASEAGGLNRYRSDGRWVAYHASRRASTGAISSSSIGFGWPGGRWLVGIVALGIIGAGVYHVYKGVTKKFLDQIDLAEAPPRCQVEQVLRGLPSVPWTR